MVEKLWKSFTTTKKASDREKLILHYLFLVKFVVGKLSANFPSFVKIDDLYSSGVTGLIRAIERFDLSRKSKFENYAILLIKGAIIDELRRLDWVPRSVHQKAQKLENIHHELQQKYQRSPTDDEVANYMGITKGEYRELLSIVRPAILLPLNAPVSNDEEANAPLSERIADQKAEISSDIAEKNESLAILEHAIATLAEIEKKVLRLYYYEELMLKEIGKILGVSESRVSQIHTQAIIKLRTQVKRQQ